MRSGRNILKETGKFVGAVATIAALMFPVAQASAGTSIDTVVQPSETVSNVSVSSDVNIDAFIKTAPGGFTFFDEALAKQTGASEEQLAKGRAYNLFAQTYAAQQSRGLFDGPAVIPGYNYCGLGNRGWDKAPTGRLDEICQAHDLCYVNRGDHTCSCDQEFIDAVSREVHTFNWWDQTVGNAGISFFHQQISHRYCS